MNNIDIVALLSTYQGRINRAKYWIAVGCYVGALLVVGLLSILLAMGFLFFIVALVIYIPMIVSGIFVGIKRLHDRDKSGWWLLVFYAVPLLLSWIGMSTGLDFIFSLASLAVSIWALVELGFLAGTPGPNRYGPDPLTA